MAAAELFVRVSKAALTGGTMKSEAVHAAELPAERQTWADAFAGATEGNRLKKSVGETPSERMKERMKFESTMNISLVKSEREERTPRIPLFDEEPQTVGRNSCVRQKENAIRGRRSVAFHAAMSQIRCYPSCCTTILWQRDSSSKSIRLIVSPVKL
jgi:hypothetical protein